ncbi:hypothetical protein MYMAC_000115 [Corallococcus macrosporus DSM 14697]|uniref:HTH iclR-type domain-containing protein n=1 Tax=Corallococcus macrosporus DSM 14697 TaxID=1189310 RepID=A0A250JKZ0_9BACT|nr:hypothetical protein MYMAC_000115 [Corallococcus macrosporus DSM 14697]
MMTADVREAFWSNGPRLPRGVELLRQDVFLVPRRGPGGQSVYELAEVVLPQVRVPVLLAYRAPLFPADIRLLRERLLAANDALKQRDGATGRLPTVRVPMIATDSASPAVIEACEREDVAVLDQRGTFFLRAGGTFIRVQGREPLLRRPREPVFHGKGCRVVRVLLQSPGEAQTVRALSERTQTSYAYAHGVIRRLVLDGYVESVSKRSGFRLRAPVDLLRAWMESGEKTAVTLDGFNAPSTTGEVLGKGMRQLESQGVRAIFTLASALLPEERFVSGLPHGLYLTGSIDAAISAFGLRRMTPHNFWVLRAEPSAETDAGGIFFAQRGLVHGPGVALPQLAVDFQRSGGRGKEQADELVQRFARALPIPEESP